MKKIIADVLIVDDEMFKINDMVYVNKEEIGRINAIGSSLRRGDYIELDCSEDYNSKIKIKFLEQITSIERVKNNG